MRSAAASIIPIDRFQPLAADDVGSVVGKVAIGSPLNGIVELAGPEQFRFDEIHHRQNSAALVTRLRNECYLFLTKHLEQKEIHMSEGDLELLITLDDPGDAREEDTFNHLQAKNTLEYWLGQRFPAGCRLDQRTEAVSGNDAYKVTFGQGDWTCTLSTLTGTTNVSMKGMNGNVVEPPIKKFDIEVCTVYRSEEWGDCRAEGLL